MARYPKAQGLSGDELRDFVLKVNRLRDEGLPIYAILERLGVRRSTYNDRMRRHRAAKG